MYVLGLEKELSDEKKARSSLEQEAISLNKRIALLEYDLKEAKKTEKQLESVKAKSEQEASRTVCFSFGFGLFILILLIISD